MSRNNLSTPAILNRTKLQALLYAWYAVRMHHYDLGYLFSAGTSNTVNLFFSITIAQEWCSEPGKVQFKVVFSDYTCVTLTADYDAGNLSAVSATITYDGIGRNIIIPSLQTKTFYAVWQNLHTALCFHMRSCLQKVLHTNRQVLYVMESLKAIPVFDIVKTNPDHFSLVYAFSGHKTILFTFEISLLDGFYTIEKIILDFNGETHYFALNEKTFSVQFVNK